MTPRFQRSLRPLICIVVGLLVFIFMIPNYMSLFASGDEDSEIHSFSAYESISFDDDEAPAELLKKWVQYYSLGSKDASSTALLSIVAVLLIFAIVVAIVAIIWGILGMVKEFAGIDVMEMAHLDSALTGKIPSWILLGNMLIHIVAAFMTLLACLINLYTYQYLDITFGLQPGVGLFLLLILGIVAFVGYRYLDKLVPAEERGPSVVYECSVCKARAKASAKFCSACGGPVVAVEKAPAGNVCPACGARMKADDKFCPACGTAAAPRRDVCSVCGTKLPANAQFCTVCGTAVPTQTEPPVQQSTAQQSTESPEDIQVQ